MLISIISLGNSENRNEVGRLEAIFDLMDFSHNAQISLDELVSIAFPVVIYHSVPTLFAYLTESTVSAAGSICMHGSVVVIKSCFHCAGST